MNSNEILEKYFGYSSFRNGQGELVSSIMQGRDTLGVMPTGAGKSICYQVPALMHSGITIVISPLISLMQDQVTALVQAGIPAAYINSSLTMNQLYTVIKNASNGVYRLIYVAPERLDSEIFLDFAVHADISMITVDEAHCISQWGQDFRPSYLNIPKFAAALPKRPIMTAFTATATERVRRDIISLLGLADPFVLVTGFDRKNLYFEVRKPSDKYSDVKRMVKAYSKEDRSGIIYCSTRKNVEGVCEKLIRDGFAATRYHAGLSEEERRVNQEDFIYDRKKIMVATNAFGMGIDKSNVSFVIHYNMPKDVESYYQEAGRAGRDGSEADCILLYSGQDYMTAKFLIEKSYEDSALEPDAAAEIKSRDMKRLYDMTNYCTRAGCLRAYILRYFGESYNEKCGNCSDCCGEAEASDITIEAQKIMSCIFRCGQSQNVDTVSSILRGDGADAFKQLSTYGIMKDTSHDRICSIAKRLRDMGYIDMTGNQLRLTRSAAEVLKGNVRVEARIYEPEVIRKHTNGADNALFEKLVELRKHIAGVQSVPAYVIFTDASLREMSELKPVTLRQLRKVGGVSSAKLERYGDRFVEVIRKYAEENTAKEKKSGRSRRKAPPEAAYSEILAGSSEINIPEEDMFISNISEYIINDTKAEMSKSALRKDITAWLISEGMLEKYTDDEGKEKRSATEKGIAIGMYNEKRIAKSTGTEYTAVLYSPEAQKFIVDSLERVKEMVINEV